MDRRYFPPEVLEEIVDAELDAQLLIDVVDGSYLVTHASRAGLRLFGIRGRLPGELPLPDVLPESLRSLITSTCVSVWDSGKPVNITDLEWPQPARRKSRWVDVRIRRLYGGLSLKCLDVTERHESQAELAMSRAHYKMLAEYSSDVVFTSEAGTLTWVSPSVKSVLGWSPADMVGKHISEFLHPDEIPLAAGAAAGVDAGHPARYEARFKRRKGDWLWLAITARPLFDDRGHVIGRVGSGRDISSRIVAEQALQESERLVRLEREALRSILDSSLDPQVVVRALTSAEGDVTDFEFVDCNVAATAYLHTARSELLGSRLGQRFPSVASERMIDWMRSVLETGTAIVRHQVELFPRIAGGERRYYDISITRLPRGVTFTWRDVTAAFESSAALAESEELFRLTTQNSPIALCLIAPDGSFLEVNRALCDLLGRDEQTLRRTTWQELTHPDDLDVDLDLVADLLEGKRDTYRLTKRYLKPDGTLVWGELSVSSVRDGHGTVRHFISQILDITELVDQRQAVAASERHYRLLAENTGDIVATVAADGRVRWVSPSVTATLGWAAHDVVGRQISEFVHAGDWSTIAELMADNRDGMRMSGSFRVVRQDGSLVWMDASASTTGDEEGDLLRIVRLRDVDHEFRAAQRLQRSEQRFRTAMNASPVGTAVLDRRGRIVQANEALCRMLGREQADLIGTGIAGLTHGPHAVDLWEQVAGGAVESAVGETEVITAGGDRVWVQEALAAVIDDDGQRNSVVAQFVDISQAKQAQVMLQYEASHDPLTDLKNRRAVMASMATLLSSESQAGERVAVLYCDLDAFKGINDTYGHAVGDKVLTEVGRRIRRCVRVGDTVGRVEGDEFVVLLTEVRAADDALGVAETIREAVSAPMRLGSDEVRLTLSIGVALAAPGEDPADVLAIADQGLYRAKGAGRDRVCRYDPDGVS